MKPPWIGCRGRFTAPAFICPRQRRRRFIGRYARGRSKPAPTNISYTQVKMLPQFGTFKEVQRVKQLSAAEQRELFG